MQKANFLKIGDMNYRVSPSLTVRSFGAKKRWYLFENNKIIQRFTYVSDLLKFLTILKNDETTDNN